MLREELQKALKESMLNKDTDTVSAVRLIIAGMKEKDVDARGKGLKEASDADLMSMMQSMIKQRNDSRAQGNQYYRALFAQTDERCGNRRCHQGRYCRNRCRFHEGHGQGYGSPESQICRTAGFWESQRND